MSKARIVAATVLLCAGVWFAPAFADEYRDFYQLYKSGDPA